MRIASVSEVNEHLKTYIEQSETEGPLVITRDGRPAAVLLVPVDDGDLERLVLSRSPRFQALLEKSWQSLRAGKGLSRDDFWKAVEQRPQERTAQT